jgi:alcohol dehydrogenase
VVIDAATIDDVPGAVFDATEGGAHVSVDALGNAVTANNSILSLRPLGRHVQIGLFPAATADIAISRVVRDELEVLGVHGLSSSRFAQVFALIEAGRLDPAAVVTSRITLDDVPQALPAMASFSTPGVSVVTAL